METRPGTAGAHAGRDGAPAPGVRTAVRGADETDLTRATQETVR